MQQEKNKTKASPATAREVGHLQSTLSTAHWEGPCCARERGSWGMYPLSSCWRHFFLPKNGAAVSPCLIPYQTEYPGFSVKKEFWESTAWCTLIYESQHPKPGREMHALIEGMTNNQKEFNCVILTHQNRIIPICLLIEIKKEMDD